MRMPRWSLGVAAIVVATGISGLRLLAQDRDDARWREDCLDRSHRDFRSTYCDVRVQRIPSSVHSLSVDGRENGGIEIEGSSGDSIVVHELIESEAPSADEARDQANQIQVVTNGASIHAEGPPSAHRHSWSVSYRILVPKHMDLTLTTTNGPLSIDGVSGTMDLHAVNGPIELEDVGGDVHARGQNGPLEVRLAGRHWEGAGLDATTENGPVDLQLPAQYGAHLETGTVNGPMDLDYPVTLQGRIDLHRLSLDLGAGGPPVRVETTNGPVSVKRG